MIDITDRHNVREHDQWPPNFVLAPHPLPGPVQCTEREWVGSGQVLAGQIQYSVPSHGHDGTSRETSDIKLQSSDDAAGPLCSLALALV